MRRILGTGEVTNFKFGVRMASPISWTTKYLQKGRGRCQGPGAEFLNFKPPSVNLEWVKLETSNSVYGKSHVKHDKIPSKGRSQGLVTKNWILNPLRKSKTGEARDFKFGVRIDPGKSHLMTDKIPP